MITKNGITTIVLALKTASEYGLGLRDKDYSKAAAPFVPADCLQTH